MLREQEKELRETEEKRTINRAINREVPRSADYEYEYVWVSRILTR